MAGISFLAGHHDVTLNVPTQQPDGEVPGPIYAAPKYAIAGAGMLWRPGAYAMLEVAPISCLKLIPGLRVDYSSESNQWTADPRVVGRFDVAPGPRRTTLKGAFGAFHQPPQPFEAIKPFGSSGVKNNLAIHYSLGVEQQIARPRPVVARQAARLEQPLYA